VLTQQSAFKKALNKRRPVLRNFDICRAVRASIRPQRAPVAARVHRMRPDDLWELAQARERLGENLLKAGNGA
jgi:hypothetical protein